MNDFPKWIYWPDGRAELVEGPAELMALPEGWAESPAAFDVPAETEGSEPGPETIEPPKRKRK